MDQDGSLTTPNILVSSIGKLSAGTADMPFASQFNFVLTGDRASAGLILGKEVNNKVIAVQGGVLRLIAADAGTTITRLVNPANKGDRIVRV